MNTPRMTVKEVAEALGVSDRTIRDNVARLFPGIAENGKTTYLDEEQVTAIKQAIERSGRTDLANIRQVGNVTTALEIEEMTLKVIAYHKAEADRLRAEVAGLRPDANAARVIANADGLKPLSEIGKINGIGPRRIFDYLIAEHVLYRTKDGCLPYQKYIDAGYFKVRESTFRLDDIDHLYSRTYVTGKGETWIACHLPARIPELFEEVGG